MKPCQQINGASSVMKAFHMHYLLRQWEIKIFNVPLGRPSCFSSAGPNNFLCAQLQQQDSQSWFNIMMLSNESKQGTTFHNPGPQPAKNFGRGKVTFGNDYDVIDMQSTMMRLFCYDQLTNIGGGTFS